MTQDELNSALMEAARCGVPDFVKLRLSEGADVNAKDMQGYTALHWAAFFGRDEIVRLLVANGAKVDAININGDDPCTLASEHGHESIATYLNQTRKQPLPVNVREWISLDQAREQFPHKGVIAGNYVALTYMCQLAASVFNDHLVANGINEALAETMEAGVAAAAIYFSAKGIHILLSKSDRQVPREILDEVRATSEHAVARRDGKLGLWLVHQPGQEAPVAMTESTFKQYEQQLAREGQALAKIVVGFTGSVTVTRTVGGKLHADGMPAVVVINPQTNERNEKWFTHGKRENTPYISASFEDSIGCKT